MVVLILILLLASNIAYAAQCRTNCTVGQFDFRKPFYIPDDECQQRISRHRCSVSLTFNYKDRTYSVQFDDNPLSHNYIYIASGPNLFYTVDYTCPEEIDCTISYARNLYNEMIEHKYNVGHLYTQIAPYIENPSRESPLQCYDMNNQIITCLPDELCTLKYEQINNTIKSRGCISEHTTHVAVFDSESSSYFYVNCALNLCNDIVTYTHIKTLFVVNNLNDTTRQRISTGTKTIASSSFLVIFLLTSLIFKTKSFFLI